VRIVHFRFLLWPLAVIAMQFGPQNALWPLSNNLKLERTTHAAPKRLNARTRDFFRHSGEYKFELSLCLSRHWPWTRIAAAYQFGRLFKSGHTLSIGALIGLSGRENDLFRAGRCLYCCWHRSCCCRARGMAQMGAAASPDHLTSNSELVGCFRRQLAQFRPRQHPLNHEIAYHVLWAVSY